MRFPSFTDLDADQRAIYNGAPPTDSILVIGPPGTGKTVMAFHRAALLKLMSKKQPGLEPTVIMFSKVLSTYTSSRGDVARDVESSTMHAWVGHWWRRAFRQKAPALATDQWRHDWATMLQQLVVQTATNAERLHWGHLVVDEGQDFPSDLYRTMAVVARLIAARSTKNGPAISVFADENQRLCLDANSTLAEIESALALQANRVYKLRKNYRNSRQIAEFAKHYYSGLPSGIPDIPARLGPSKPVVVVASSLEVVRRRLRNYARNHAGSDIGVLCANDVLRKRVFNSLATHLEGTGIVVQTYAWNAREEHPPENLRFDAGGSVTVINFPSAKGLEFDAVYLIDPLADAGGASIQQANMRLYVMASRAREYLELMILNPPRDLAGRLPHRTLYEQIEE